MCIDTYVSSQSGYKWHWSRWIQNAVTTHASPLHQFSFQILWVGRAIDVLRARVCYSARQCLRLCHSLSPFCRLLVQFVLVLQWWVCGHFFNCCALESSHASNFLLSLIQWLWAGLYSVDAVVTCHKVNRAFTYQMCQPALRPPRLIVLTIWMFHAKHKAVTKHPLGHFLPLLCSFPVCATLFIPTTGIVVLYVQT